MVIHQIKSWSIFVSESTKKGKKVKLQNGTYKNLPHQYIKEYKIGYHGRKSFGADNKFWTVSKICSGRDMHPR